MENLNTFFWIMSAGFGILFGLMAIIWNSINSRFDRMDDKFSNKIDSLDIRLSHKIDKLDEKLTDVNRRLWGLEGTLASKDCCMIKDDRNMAKAE